MSLNRLISTVLLSSCTALCLYATAASADDTGAAPQHTEAAVAMQVPAWTLRLPELDTVAYQGVVSLDQAGMDMAPMMYPAVDPISMLAAVLTHGAIVGAEKKRQKTQLQEQADRVLSPYQQVLAAYTHRQLMQRGLELATFPGNKSLAATSEPVGEGWLVESAPLFSMTQDQYAIVLDLAVRVYASPAVKKPAYVNSIRVVSRAHEVADPVAFWTTGGGSALKDESAGLLAESLDILAGELANDSSSATGAQKTVRYRQGATDMMERALVLRESCGRLLIRTLRGTLMSVPARAAAAVAGQASACAPPATIAPQQAALP